MQAEPLKPECVFPAGVLSLRTPQNEQLDFW